MPKLGPLPPDIQRGFKNASDKQTTAKNQQAAEDAKAAGRFYKLMDTKRLSLAVYPSGRKSWYLNYRFNEKDRTVCLGEYP